MKQGICFLPNTKFSELDLKEMYDGKKGELILRSWGKKWLKEQPHEFKIDFKPPTINADLHRVHQCLDRHSPRLFLTQSLSHVHLL